MAELKLTAIYEKAKEGGYVGYVAGLPGANMQGETIEEVRENLKEAVHLLLACYRDEAEKNLTDSATKEERFCRQLEMKRADLIRHLAKFGCIFIREGGSHTI
jgi:predicted RNase H-like HicB family nuclease